MFEFGRPAKRPFSPRRGELAIMPEAISSAGPYSKSGTTFFFKGEGRGCTGKRCTPRVRAFHRSKHLLVDLFERASRCYEWLVPTLDVLAECFEQRDALGSHDEYSE